MTITPTPPPVTGLRDLSTETRMIATPWSRMVRGIGLGQHPVDHDPVVARRIRWTFDRLATRVPASPYTHFSGRLADLILDVTDPVRPVPRAEVAARLGPVLDAARAEPNPYWRLMAGCILMDSVAKLGLDPALLSEGGQDVPGEVLAVVDDIAPDGIADENAGRHGDYEKMSACSAVFLAFGQLGLTDRLVSGPRNHVAEALDLLERVPSPFFRGRGGSTLLSVLFLLGQGALVLDGPRDYLRETLDHLDRADELADPPAFPSVMSPSFPRVYPLLTMLNSIAFSGRAEYMTYGRDRLAEARDLMARLAPVERTHMGLYYLMALHNLGRLSDQVPDLDGFVEALVGQWRDIDPGSDFFLNGIAYPYLLQTASLTGRLDLITGEALQRLVDSFPDLDRTSQDRSNRPYPVSYVVNVLGEIGESKRLYTPTARYGGDSAVGWVVDRLSEGGRAEGSRLFMLDHALISWALRLRGAGSRETDLFRKFRFVKG